MATARPASLAQATCANLVASLSERAERQVAAAPWALRVRRTAEHLPAERRLAAPAQRGLVASPVFARREPNNASATLRRSAGQTETGARSATAPPKRRPAPRARACLALP